MVNLQKKDVRKSKTRKTICNYVAYCRAERPNNYTKKSVEMEKSKKTTVQDSKDLNNSNLGNLDEEVTQVVDYGELPDNEPSEEKDKDA